MALPINLPNLYLYRVSPNPVHAISSHLILFYYLPSHPRRAEEGNNVPLAVFEPL